MGTILVAIVVLSILVQLSPVTQAALQFDRTAIAAGQGWRLLTGNFVHYSWLHLAANLGVFAALCWIAHGRSRGTLGVVMLSGLAVGGAVYQCADGIVTYRGISGVDCALLAWVLIIMAVQDRGWRAAGWVGVLVLVVGKSAYELVTGQLLFPTSAPVEIEVVGVTHVIGLATGMLAVVVARLDTPVATKIAGVEQPLPVCLHEESVCIVGRVIHKIWRQDKRPQFDLLAVSEMDRIADFNLTRDKGGGSSQNALGSRTDQNRRGLGQLASEAVVIQMRMRDKHPEEGIVGLDEDLDGRQAN